MQILWVVKLVIIMMITYVVNDALLQLHESRAVQLRVFSIQEVCVLFLGQLIHLEKSEWTN